MSNQPFQETNISYLSSRLKALLHGSTRDKFIGTILLTNLGFLLLRPQVIAPFLSDFKITIALFLLCFFFWLKRYSQTWHSISNLIMLLLGIHAIMILVARFLWSDLVINTGAAALVWFDIVQYLFCFLFPVLVYLTHSDQFRRLNSLLIFAGVYIALYAVNHEGRGPSGFLGDENDCGLMLVFLFPYALLSFPLAKNSLRRLLIILSAAIIIAGIIATNSRGTFVGLVATLFFIFVHSHHKKLLVTLSIIGFIVAIPFVPEQYVERIKTIRQTDQGTAQTRFEYWGTALKAWSDPRFTLQGVGFNNIPWRLHQYQAAEFGLTKEGMGGRQVHSLHIQIIADLGIIGFILLGYATYRSIKGNNRCRRELLRAERAVQQLSKRHQKVNSSNELIINANSPIALSNKFLKQVIKTQSDISFLLIFFNALNASWIALLTAGSFISVLYYPTPWMILILSLAAQLYWQQLKSTLSKSLQLCEELLPS